ncbi:MAG: 2-amino-4-hydroxy-6-hydroxymethyldihydropteridine diphosphokinase [bacterium]
MNDIYLALGSNIGNRLKYIKDAINLIKSDPKISFMALSNIYLTKAYGVKDQNDFYNCVCKISTEYSPFELLKFCKKSEKQIGRIKSKKWGPRQIDIDILFYNDVVLNSDILTIPHREFEKRDFFICPMLDITEDFIHPLFREPIKLIYDRLKEKFVVKRFNINTNEELNCLN